MTIQVAVQKGFALLAAGALACVCSHALQSPTIEQVLQRNESAVDPGSVLAKVTALRLNGLTRISDENLETPVTISVKRPNLVRIDGTAMGKPSASGFDGTAAWATNINTGKVDRLPLDQLATISLASLQIEIITGFLRGIVSGRDARFDGAGDVSGVKAFRVRASGGGLPDMTYFIDQATYLLLKTSSITNDNGNPQTIESFPGEYQVQDGVRLAHSLVLKADGKPVFQFRIQQIEINPAVEDAVFKAPDETPKKPVQ